MNSITQYLMITAAVAIVALTLGQGVAGFVTRSFGGVTATIERAIPVHAFTK